MLEKPRVNDSALWKQRFRTRAFRDFRVAAAEPTRGLAVATRDGESQFYAWDVPSGRLKHWANLPGTVDLYAISPDGRYLYYLRDEEGNDLGHWVRIRLGNDQPEDLTPDLPPYASYAITFDLTGNVIGFNAHHQGDGFRAYLLNLASGGTPRNRRVIYRSRSPLTAPWLSHGGEIAIIGSTERGGPPHVSLIAIDTATGEQIGELWDGPQTSLQPPGSLRFPFSPVAGGCRFLTKSNRGEFVRPVIWNPITEGRIDLDLEELMGDVSPVAWSPDGQSILLSRIHQAAQALYVYNLLANDLQPLDHPSGTFGILYFGLDGKILASWESSSHAPCVVELDGRTGTHTRTLLTTGGTPAGRAWESVTFPSSDGQRVQMWIATPEGPGPFPTIIDVHGGPWTVQMDTYSPESQAWLDHGFAFASVNYRGSITFGRAFRDKILDNPGYWELEDVIAARRFLVDSGIADPGRVVLTGWSYGGYLTLLALGKYPDPWAAGIAGNAVADWRATYEDTLAAGKHLAATLFGGTPEEEPELYASRSPVSYVENVSAPILILHGRNDTHAPVRQMELYHEKMRSQGKRVELVWLEGGHSGSEHNTETMERALSFTHRVLCRRLAP